MSDISVPWGASELRFDLPDLWELIQTADTALKPASPDWPQHMAMALNQPDTGLPLSSLLAARRGGKIVLILEDVTRHSPLEQILPIVLKEIRHAGIEDSQLEVVFAAGMHPAMTPEQAREKLGPLADTIAWRSNPWTDKRAHTLLGKAQGIDVAIDKGVAAADLRIVISSVSPHLQAGFGGGYKMLLPGCASIETIRGMHRLGLEKELTQLVGTDSERNGLRQFIDEGGQLLDASGGKTFSVQYLLDGNDLPTAIGTGEPLPAQRMLAKQAAVSCGVIVPASCDVLITNAAPRDFDMWQSFKGIANTLWAARPGGVVICLTRCEAGLNGIKPIKWPLSQEGTRRILKLIGPHNLAKLVMRLVPRLAGDAAFFIRMATGMLHRNPLFMVSPHLAATKVKFPGIRIFATPADALAAATELLGEGRQRVILFPNGGVTYPVPKLRE